MQRFLGKQITRASLMARDKKTKDLVVRKLSGASKRFFSRTFKGAGNLKFLSATGAFIGIGIIVLISYVIDKVRASALRSYSFVDQNYDFATRNWKRSGDIQEGILRKYFWPLYSLAKEARDVCPPYHDEASFLALACRALDEDRSLLEGYNPEGNPVRIPFRHPKKLFDSPPLSLTKNSINDLRFSHYRDLRDSHLGLRRYWLSFIQSSPFENFMMAGLRREIVLNISRGLRRAKTQVRLEDILGTADPRFVSEAIAEERDDIRAYTARKIFLKKQTPRERTFRILEDGVKNVVRELVSSDPFYLTGEAYRDTGEGRYELRNFGLCLVEDLKQLLREYGPGEDSPNYNLEKLVERREAAKMLNRMLLDFIHEQDPDRAFVTDVGDLRAVRMALQMDARLRNRFVGSKPDEPAPLLESFAEIGRAQLNYDRALLDIRGVCESTKADFELYTRFLDENFYAFRERVPRQDYDPWHAKLVPTFSTQFRRAWRFIRQKMSSR